MAATQSKASQKKFRVTIRRRTETTYIIEAENEMAAGDFAYDDPVEDRIGMDSELEDCEVVEVTS